MNRKIPVLRRAERSGGSRAANADGAPRKHGAFHSSRGKNRKAPTGLVSAWTGPSRVSRDGHARADIACDDAAGANNGAVADRDPGQDDGAAADPDVAADPHRATEFEALTARSEEHTS